MTAELPELFAIIRQAYRGPCLQILTSELNDTYSVYNRQHRRRARDSLMVVNFPNAQAFEDLSLQGTTAADTRIYNYFIQQPEANGVLEVKGWFLPYYFRFHGRMVPLMDFQYRSWIPGEYHPIPIRADLNQFLHTTESIQHERIHEIQSREDNRVPHIPFYERPYGPDDYDNRYDDDMNVYIGAGRHIPIRRHSRLDTPPPPPIARIVEVPVDRVVERVVERVVIQNRVLPLPKGVGELLLSQARKGTDACPIAATPFAECETLCVSSCFHIFDAASLSRWQEVNTTCPVCRCKIENIVSEPTPNAV